MDSDMVDATLYAFEAMKWRKWFDAQPWYYRQWYWFKQWLKRVIRFINPHN